MRLPHAPAPPPSSSVPQSRLVAAHGGGVPRLRGDWACTVLPIPSRAFAGRAMRASVHRRPRLPGRVHCFYRQSRYEVVRPARRRAVSSWAVAPSSSRSLVAIVSIDRGARPAARCRSPSRADDVRGLIGASDDHPVRSTSCRAQDNDRRVRWRRRYGRGRARKERPCGNEGGPRTPRADAVCRPLALAAFVRPAGVPSSAPRPRTLVSSYRLPYRARRLRLRRGSRTVAIT